MTAARLSFAAFLSILGLLMAPAAMAAASRLEKLQAVLAHLGIPAEPDYSGQFKEWEGVQTRKGFETILSYLDPRSELKRYLSWDDDHLVVYKDRDAKKVVDYTVGFKTGPGNPADPLHAIARIRNAAKNPAAQPLQGLRIALDPGHMGSRHWDLKTGKFVNAAGRILSEGVLTFDVCLLLKQELENLGAITMITRHGLTPASDLDPKTFDMGPEAASAVLDNTDDPWFDALLNSSSAVDSQLLAAVDRDFHLKHYFSPAARDEYFISGVDLSARADLINAFKPDLSLVIHFDAAKLTELQNRSNAVRGYVEGDMLPGEASSGEVRSEAVQALLDGHRWIESSVFTNTVIKAISRATHVPVMTSSEDYHGERVSDGVYARNLALTRLVNRGIMTYIEVLHYDYTPEFNRLTTLDRHTEIEGVKLDYSSRLDEVVVGIKQGILDYVRSMDNGNDSKQQVP